MARKRARPAKKPDVAKELRRMSEEPLLPVERKLIVWSLGLGGILLIVLIWLTNTLFP